MARSPVLVVLLFYRFWKTLDSRREWAILTRICTEFHQICRYNDSLVTLCTKRALAWMAFTFDLVMRARSALSVVGSFTILLVLSLTARRSIQSASIIVFTSSSTRMSLLVALSHRVHFL